MMVSPNYYYEEYLKEKSVEDIKAVICELKEEMQQLRKLVESDEMNEEKMLHPSPGIRLNMSREYLEEAKRALRCLLHNRITQSCKAKMDIVACPNWT